MDAVSAVMKKLPVSVLERIKLLMIRSVLSKKVFHKMRFQKKFLIAIDGTGISSYKERHCPNCTKTVSKNGVATYYHKVLEAKLVTSCGFSVSIGTVWIDNEDTINGKYNKQGCERKAFKKLAEKLKKDFPRLPICICADGLYPNSTFFKICEDNSWSYLVTLKDGNLKKLWDKIRTTNRDFKMSHTQKSTKKVQWINEVKHGNYTCNWIMCEETTEKGNGSQDINKFVHLTDMKISHKNSIELSDSGRLRWKIEKEGFDQQKNHGYNIKHKFCRISYTGMKNFYQCCQIAHLINQLIELSTEFKKATSKKITTKFIWQQLIAKMIYVIKNHGYPRLFKENKSQFVF